jgi:hypothetical protein
MILAYSSIPCGVATVLIRRALVSAILPALLPRIEAAWAKDDLPFSWPDPDAAAAASSTVRMRVEGVAEVPLPEALLPLAERDCQTLDEEPSDVFLFSR